jgi:hypothetical protein
LESMSWSSVSLGSEDAREVVSDIGTGSKMDEADEARLAERSDPLRSRPFELIGMDFVCSDEIGKSRKDDLED